MGSLVPFTLKVIYNLSFSSFRQGLYSKEESLSEAAIGGREKTRGSKDPVTLSSIEQLGMIHHKQGLQDQAQINLETALVGYKSMSGEN